MRSETRSAFLTVALMVGVGLGLSACDEAEQGRILMYEKGTYLGQPDTELPDSTVDELRARATLQGGM